MSDKRATGKPDAVPDRRRRFERQSPRYALTPGKVRLLSLIAQCGMLTTGQCSRIASISRKAAYNQLRDLFDLGLTERVSVPYVVLAPRETLTKTSVSIPSEVIHLPTKKALELLAEWDFVDEAVVARPLPKYEGGNYLHLAHEVLVRDVRVWLQNCSHIDGGETEWWAHGTDAHIAPTRPDALFVYRLPCEPAKRVVGLVEADRGTERRDRWDKKAGEYAALFASGNLAAVTRGRKKGRIVIVTLDAARRDWIAGVLDGSPVSDSYYVACRSDLEDGGMGRAIWRTKASADLVPFVTPELLEAGAPAGRDEESIGG